MSNKFMHTKDKILAILDNFFQEKEKPVVLHEPLFIGKENEYVTDCIETGWVSSVGEYVTKFEEGLSRYTKADFVIATVNGTSALHMCLLLAGVKQDEEVFVSPFTFVATVNAISYCGAIPHFVDIETESLAIDADKLRGYLSSITESTKAGLINKNTGKIIKALIVTHVFGHPANLDALVAVCEEFNIKLIEDAAEALGSFYKEKHVGTFGFASALSFNGNKIITTGGGGAILTNDADVAKLARHLTTTAKVAHEFEWSHDQIGYNYRMPNINAALGCAQLEQLPYFLSLKRKLFAIYKGMFSDISDIGMLEELPNTKSNYWLNAMIVEDKEMSRDLITRAIKEKIFLRPAWRPMHSLPMYNKCPAMNLDVASDMVERVVCLPSGAGLVK